MKFMSDFRTSMEQNNKYTNEKLDKKLEVINEKLDNKLDDINNEIRNIKDQINGNEENSHDVLNRMDDRLSLLEEEMKKSSLLSKKREELRKSEEERLASERLEEQNKQKVNEVPLPPRRKSFERIIINQEDLTNELNPQEKTTSSFKSSWANEMEEELRNASNELSKVENRVKKAERLVSQDTRRKSAEELMNLDGRRSRENRQISPRRMEYQEGSCSNLEVRDHWDKLLKKEKKLKVRKPIEVVNWFADEPTTDSDLSNDSQDEDLGWTEIEKKKVNEKKRKIRYLKKKNKMEEVASKMKKIIGIGPIPTNSVQYFEKENISTHEARKKAIKEYLAYHLEFDEEDLEQLEILETKQCASRNDIIYFVLGDQDHIREIHYRRAASCNDDLILRDYVPPQYHARYVAIGKKAAEKRGLDKSLKTQIRWGEKDLEIFIKNRNENNEDGDRERFKKTNLQDFMGDTLLPDFDMEIEWKTRRDEKTKKKITFGRKEAMIPSLKYSQPTVKPTSKQFPLSKHNKGGLHRQLSNTSREDLRKRQKRILTSSDSSDGDAEMDQSEDPLKRQDEAEESI